MKLITSVPNDEFKVLTGSPRSQAAVMTLPPSKSTGGSGNKHKESDQWLFVISGSGKAIVEGKEVELSSGSLLLIEAGEVHEIKNTGTIPLKTLNFYCPPEY